MRAEADALAADLAGWGIEVSEVQLGPLADGELAAVVSSVAPLAEDDVRRAVTAAEGNPLLAVESAQALAAGSTAPPSSLRAMVRAALGVLPPGGRELAEAIAAACRGLPGAGRARDRRARARRPGASRASGAGLRAGARRAAADMWPAVRHDDHYDGLDHRLGVESDRFCRSRHPNSDQGPGAHELR